MRASRRVVVLASAAALLLALTGASGVARPSATWADGEVPVRLAPLPLGLPVVAARSFDLGRIERLPVTSPRDAAATALLGWIAGAAALAALLAGRTADERVGTRATALVGGRAPARGPPAATDRRPSHR